MVEISRKRKRPKKLTCRDGRPWVSGAHDVAGSVGRSRNALVGVAGWDAFCNGHGLGRLDCCRLGFGLSGVDIACDCASHVNGRWLVVDAGGVREVSAPGSSWGTGGA